MSLFIEEEGNIKLDFDTEEIAALVIDAALELADCPYEAFNPESGELMLGDIVISKEKVLSQAEEYGHLPKREYAFLIAHSMLHLFGYDHMVDEERVVMEAKQKEIMEKVGIFR